MLAFGLSGFVLIGPGQLIMPIGALVDKGIFAWILLFFLYLLLVCFFSSFLRPRIILYNTYPEQLRSLIADMAFQNELEINWLGDTLDIPALGVHLTMESWPLLKHVSLVASGKQGQPGGWAQFEKLLRKAVQAYPQKSKFALRVFFTVSLIMVVTMILVGLYYSEAVLNGFLAVF